MDEDQLVRMVVVKYSLIQHLPEKDRLKYKGVTVKYIRVAVQRLVLIVPVEEQVDWPETSKEDKEVAAKMTQVENSIVTMDSKRVKKVKDAPKGNMMSERLKERGQFDVDWAKVIKWKWQQYSISVCPMVNMGMLVGQGPREIRDMVEKSYIYTFERRWSDQ